MSSYFIIPGLGNSGPLHWQTYFEESAANFTRIDQKEWDAPVCSDWLLSVDEALKDADLSEVILIGHSLGCATIAHWAKHSGKRIKGAMLVAPSDVEALNYTFPAIGFAPMPLDRFDFKTLVVASVNDEWVSIERAKYFADCWGSRFVDIGEAGHINAASGFYKWNEGLEFLKKLD
ncbi:alpha/beta fold hydrolase [Pedobacter sp. HMF7647]|uniref:Alpha/beta fold hydrolase n=1 Tax=Hufsiella arboris TaxID=2695275 RepID=A0A7K1Y693_9SPHI|nr:alpha/beta hydrolase [Hufsiella arboris]MXV49931.1 alpha/beta fold hydrolase [Hufsiella arboris]